MKLIARRSSAKFWIIAGLTLLATTAGLAALTPLALSGARHESAELTTQANQSSGGEAATDYLLATKLNSANQTAFAGLARSQIAIGQPAAALASLTKAGQGSAVEQLKIRTLLELGRYFNAAQAAAALTAPGRSDSDLLLASFAYDLQGKSLTAAALTSRITSPDTLQALQRAEIGGLPLATELYVNGLLRSSSAILSKLPVSYEGDLLRARIDYAQHATPATVTSLLITANTLNPSNTDARLLLASIYRAENDLPEATEQAALVKELRSGRP